MYTLSSSSNVSLLIVFNFLLPSSSIRLCIFILGGIWFYVNKIKDFSISICISYPKVKNSSREIIIRSWFYRQRHYSMSMSSLSPQIISLFDLPDRWFLAPPFARTCRRFQEVVDVCLDQTIKRDLDALDCDFDGLVIKVNDLSLRELLWATNHHPRWAIAYKYPAKQATSTVIRVERQVGRTGVLTPVAHIDPVVLSGATISKVTLHNPDVIREKDIRIGDRVFVQRSWEVIPYIVCSIPDARDGTQQVVPPPLVCTVCWDRTHIEQAESGSTSYYCINTTCPATIKETIKHFVGRDMMNIEWVGDALIDAMVDHQIIVDCTDLYKLLSDPVMRMITKNIPGMGDKKITLIAQWLEQSKKNLLHKIIYALGIPQVWEKTARILVDHLKELILTSDWSLPTDSKTVLSKILLYLQDEQFLQSIHSIGKETSSSIIDWFCNSHNQWLVDRLIGYGVELTHWWEDTMRDSDRLQYVRFAISGIFPHSRDQIISYLVKQGATYCPTITSNTNLLIVWENPSSKLKKALDKWIECVQWVDGLYQRFDLPPLS